ncbi:hypothetical protein SH139x_004921 [Planctomycetaceae bacterium SH139]
MLTRKYSVEAYNLRIELDTKDCELSASEITRLERALEPLRKPVEKFRDRPSNVPLGTWLEQLIDPSLRQLSRHTLDELEIISFTRSARSGGE